MNTPHVDDQLLALVERRLPALERARVEAHLAHCQRCRAAASELHQSVTALAGLPGARQVEAVLERRGVRQQLWAALLTLPTHLREAVALRYVAEMRYKEIGEAVGCNPKTAESRVRLGLAAMRRTLEAWGVERAADLVEQWA